MPPVEVCHSQGKSPTPGPALGSKPRSVPERGHWRKIVLSGSTGTRAARQPRTAAFQQFRPRGFTAFCRRPCFGGALRATCAKKAANSLAPACDSMMSRLRRDAMGQMAYEVTNIGLWAVGPASGVLLCWLQQNLGIGCAGAKKQVLSGLGKTADRACGQVWQERWGTRQRRNLWR